MNLNVLEVPDFSIIGCDRKELTNEDKKENAIELLEALLKTAGFFIKVEFSRDVNRKNKKSNKELLEKVHSVAKRMQELCKAALYCLVSPQVVKVIDNQINKTIGAAKKFAKDSSRFDFALKGVKHNFWDLFKVIKAFSL